ncbi:MAG: TIGR03087 family PEP-CTERM/XrtA system glycosyltransferase [Cellvibrionaceae bacterium]
MTKPKLLFLCHRIPYPPNKGDKIRSYHLLRFLCRSYRVYLGCFVDDPDDLAYVDFLRDLCEEVIIVELSSLYKKVTSLTAFLTNSALTIPYYHDKRLSHWVEETVMHESIDRCVVFSSSMGQYLYSNSLAQLRSVVDLVDVDSDKWRQYSKKKYWPLSWLYRREAKLLLEFEKALIDRSEQSLLVSSSEASLMKNLSPGLSNKIDYYNNGVDADYYDPQLSFDNPYPPGVQVLTFTGAMDYWPNVDAVSWFGNKVFPKLRARYPELLFYIVGRNPVRDVEILSRIDGVVVTGIVEDVRPYLKHATAVVAPLRVARGIQNKILEAMAMENRVMASSQGLEGINAELGSEVLLANNLDDYFEYLPKIINGECETMGINARTRILSDFDWESSLPIITRFLERDSTKELQKQDV